MAETTLRQRYDRGYAFPRPAVLRIGAEWVIVGPGLPILGKVPVDEGAKFSWRGAYDYAYRRAIGDAQRRMGRPA